MVGAMKDSIVTSFQNDPSKSAGYAVGTIASMFVPVGGGAAAATRGTEAVEAMTRAEQAAATTMTAAGQASEHATMTVAGQAGEHASVTASGQATAAAADLEPATVAVGARQETAAATTASTGRGGTTAATDNAGQGARSGSEAPNTPSASGSGNKPPTGGEPPEGGQLQKGESTPDRNIQPEENIPPTEQATKAETEPLGARGEMATLDWSRVSARTGGDVAEHVTLNHGSLSLTKPNQGVFYGSPASTIEDAWAIAQRNGLKPVTDGNRDIYVVPRQNSGYAGGMGGQLENYNYVTIITEAGTNRVVTGYPSGRTPPLPRDYNFSIGE
jgi:filamentous hemagglutinin